MLLLIIKSGNEFFNSSTPDPCQFNIIIAGLDNIEARRWINSFLHSAVERDPATGEVDSSTIIVNIILKISKLMSGGS